MLLAFNETDAFQSVCNFFRFCLTVITSSDAKIKIKDIISLIYASDQNLMSRQNHEKNNSFIECSPLTVKHQFL
jgi:hypothetical protein